MDIFSAQRLIGEDVIQTLFERFQIIENIRLYQPMGRRKLSLLLSLPERKIRSHLEYLQSANLVIIDKRGVLLNPETEDVTPFLVDFFTRLNSEFEKETKLEKLLGVKKVIVAPGNVEADPAALANLGMKAENYFTECLGESGCIAVSGGSSLKAFTDSLRSVNKTSYVVIPVRGAIGSSHSYQANTISLYTGMKLKCNALQLSIPDNISTELLNTLKDHPDIAAVTSMYKKIDILLFGIGRADTMASHRTLSDSEKESIIRSSSAAEAVGYYFSSNGRAVKKASGIGIDLDDLRRIPVKIAIAGGESKKSAIEAVCGFMQDIVLVTDESCADALLK